MICKWADDSQRLILEYFDVICRCPSELYHYAVPFSPSSSWLHECYSSKILQGVGVVKGLQVGWGTCSRTIPLKRTPTALTCWKDLIAINQDSKIIILSAATGVPIFKLSEHTDIVRSLAFSLDGTFLVSGDCNKVILWDMQTGGSIKTKTSECGIGMIYSISISVLKDCATIALGSFHRTICIWDTETEKCHHITNGHNAAVTTVSFSPVDSNLFISASYDDTIKQWNVSGSQTGPTCKGNHANFSPDGTHFVSWRKLTLPQVAACQNTTSGVVAVQNTTSGEATMELQALGSITLLFLP